MWIFKIFPMYCFTEGVINVPSKDLFGATEDPVNNDKNSLDMDIAGGALLFLGLHTIFDTLLLIFIEFVLAKIIRMIKIDVKDDDVPEDEDVTAEKTRVSNFTDEDDSKMAVKADKLRKTYVTGPTKRILACKEVSFGLEFGECFALLGINGAGKTTTFKMLTGDVAPTAGNMKICGYDVKK